MRAAYLFKVIPVMLVFSLVTACGALTQSDRPPVTTWWLEPYEQNVQSFEATDGLRSVSIEVSAVPGMDTDKVLALTGANALKPYAGARWADHIPDIVESLLGRSLTASGQYEQLQPGKPSAHGVCRVQLEVREFFAALGAAGQTDEVRISLVGNLQCDSQPPVPVRLTSALAVNRPGMAHIVSVFQAAMDDVTKTLLRTINNENP